MRPPKFNQLHITDPSQLHRPEESYSESNAFLQSTNDLNNVGKDKAEFRIFDEDLCQEHVQKVYLKMHTQQTVSSVKEKHKEWLNFDHAEMGLLEAVMTLDDLIDESDPDIDLPNSVHAFQTAERIREQHPDKDWFHLVGLIHDVGKLMALLGEPQHFVVGDTFPLGCKFSDKIVFTGQFKDNPDSKIPEYSTNLGMYEENCGLDNVLMSWGHDEYMYQALKHNGCKLPKEGLYMIKYHSFYPWHCSEEYDYLCNDQDREMLPWVREFNKFDLYSKADGIPNIEEVKPYYQGLIDKYCPGVLKW